MINRQSIPLIAAMLAALAAIAMASVVVWHQFIGNARTGELGPGEAAVAPGVTMGGDFALIDHTGQPATLDSFAGRHMLIYFGYTFCPDVCPTELSTMAAAVDILADADPKLADRVTPVFITVDPARDTVDVIAEYAAAFHPRMVGLTGDLPAISDAARKFRVYFSNRPADEYGDYLVDHSSYVYLMGPDGGFVTLLRGGVPAEDMATTLTRYLGETPTS